ncbi:MAG: hypothetical protein HC804_13230 [Anaerolineae bacterium]|nr:hypothetical protein [Anaerolineae bacterium]
METVRWENPHVDNGIITADGNINLTIHNPAWNPWQGTLLAVRLVRFFPFAGCSNRLSNLPDCQGGRASTF